MLVITAIVLICLGYILLLGIILLLSLACCIRRFYKTWMEIDKRSRNGQIKETKEETEQR